MVEAIAQFDYTPQEPDELTLQKGDVIGDIVFKSEGWWEGTLLKNKQRGMFPDNFVKVMEEESTAKDASSKKKPIRLCKVRFSYTPANSDELLLKVDDIIQILGEVEEGWWSGQLNDQIGVFPSNFVEEILNLEPPPAEKPALKEENSSHASVAEKNAEPHAASVIVGPKAEPDAPSLPPKPVKEQYQALYAWEAQNDDELTLEKGDVITLITKEVADKGWWKGELAGKVGVFPDNFVSPYVAPEPKLHDNVKATSNQKESPLKLNMSSNQIANVRKSLDNSPKGESQSSPPIVSKKLQLPPPPPPALKKSQCSPSVPNTSVSPSGSLAKTNSGTSLKLSLPAANSPPQSPTKKEQDSAAAGAARAARLSASVSAPSAVSPISKALSPKERSESSVSESAKETVDGCLPSKLTSGSYNVTNPPATPPTVSPNTSVNLTNSGESTKSNGVDTDLDVVSRDGSLYHPTLFRAKAPRKRPPSTIILKEEFNLPDELTNGNGTVTNETNVEVTETSPHQANKPPWVEELKLNQAKKNLLQGRTRVIIGPNQTTSSSSETGSNMTSTTIISAQTAPATAKRSEKVITYGKSTFLIESNGVVFKRGGGGGSSNVLVREDEGVIQPSNPETAVRSGANKDTPLRVPESPVQEAATNDSVKVSRKEWNELYSKIDRLELALLNQQETHSKELGTLRKQLNEEIGHRKRMRQEIDKLMDLMTQEQRVAETRLKKTQGLNRAQFYLPLINAIAKQEIGSLHGST